MSTIKGQTLIEFIDKLSDVQPPNLCDGSLKLTARLEPHEGEQV